jgi:MoaA/NifB/PqqE/SkfB family radical SAM enzyme
MYTNKKPIKFHIELTDKCNALCVQCSRNMIDKDGVVKPRPDLLLTELTLEDFKFMFEDIGDVMDCDTPVGGVTFCGNFGDPIAARELLPICKFLIEEVNVKYIHVHTNGSLKTTKWWSEFGKLFAPLSQKDRSGTVVTFAIDGLEDTHHLYRTNTNYNKVIENAKAFIDAGGSAEWSMIEFGHNEHQVETCKQMAKDMGFISFNHSKTHRFRGKDYIDYKHKGKDYRITAPSLDKRIDSGKKKWEEKQQTYIDCKVSRRNELYIGADGKVDACCWMGSASYYVDNLGKQHDEPIYEFFHDMKEELNVRKIKLKDIIFDQFFTSILPGSFKSNPCTTCVRTCGNEYRTFRDRQQL